MDKKRRILCLFLAGIMLLSLILSICTPAFAAEVTGKFNLTVSVIDQSGGYPGESFKAIFKMGDNEEVIEFSKENTWGTNMVVNQMLPAPGDYKVTFEGLEKGYVVINTLTKEKAETSFKVKEGEEKFFGWGIVTTEQLNATRKENTNAAVGRNPEAEKLYTDFLDAISFIEEDESWNKGVSALLNQYGEESFNYQMYGQWYEDYVWGGSLEEYLSLTNFQKFLWTETYTRLANAKNSGWGYEYFFASERAFEENIILLVTNTMNGENAQTVIDAYTKLMNWQYDYIQKYEEPYNFIRNRSYSTELDVPYDKEDFESTGEEVVEVDIEESKGIWDDTIDALARNSVSIIILLILGGISAWIYHIRKEKNLGENSH